MKKNIILLAIAMLGTTAFFSCTKKDNNSTPGASMTATINGVAFNGTNCTATASGGALAVTGGVFSTTPTFPYVTVSVLTGYTGAGTYALGGTNIAGIDSSSTNVPQCAYGTLTITATSPQIVGTFSFTCTDSTKVTNGSFTATAQ